MGRSAPRARPEGRRRMPAGRTGERPRPRRRLGTGFSRVRLPGAKRGAGEERRLWSRDLRFVHRLAATLPGVRTYELDAGIVVIGPSDELTDAWAAEIAAESHSPSFGLVSLDARLPEGERHLFALSAAVQQS